MFNSKKMAGLLIGASFTILSAFPAYAGTYTVASGDSLYTIGKLFNTTAAVIMKSSSLWSEVIYPGQVLTVPSRTYTVKSGDSLYLIAKNNQVSLDALRKANNLWGDSIYPGQKLNLPGAAVSSAGQSASGTQTSQGTSTANKIAYTANDADLLARLITAEADGEPYNAKVAVGAVVVNRVKDSRFPNTLSSVIYEKSDGFYQFTPVENGWINKPASEDAKKAALEALKGVDPTNGAVFYFDDSATNKWLWSKPIAARIGKMVFTY